MAEETRISFLFEDEEKIRANLPTELKNLKQWVAFTASKIPINPNTSKNASPTDRTTWGTLDEACRCALGQHRGVGFVFSGDDPYVGIDLDDCFEEGRPNVWARGIIDRFDSYTETSLNGGGVHIIGRGSVPGDRNRKDKVEIYDTDRYFVVTGGVFDGRNEIKDIQSPLNNLYAEVFGKEKQIKKEATVSSEKSRNVLSDSEIIKKASNSKNGDKFRQLWAGDWEGHYDSPSEADLALCSLLAFWTNSDIDAMDRLFRQSGLIRPKWDKKHGEQTYGEKTLVKALKDAQDGYTGPPPPREVDAAAGQIGLEDFKKRKYTSDNIRLSDDIIRNSGFFAKYLEYTEQITDAPREFLFTSILTAVAGVLGNQVYLKRGSNVYPNLYSLLIGPSTIVRKSTSLDLAESFVANLEGEKLLFPNSITPEALYAHLAERSAYGFWKISEFGAFLKSLGRTYMSGFKEDLTDFYDVPRLKVRTRKANTSAEKKLYDGKFVDLRIERPAISLCAGSTADWFNNNLEDGDIGGGWLARFIFSTLPGRTKPKVAWPEPIDAEMEEGYIHDIQTDLERIHALRGEYRIMQDAKSLYSEWYADLAEELFLENASNGEQLAPFVERHMTVTLKLAMIFQASMDSKMIISFPAMQKAITTTIYFLLNVQRLLRDEISVTWIERQVARFVKNLKKLGGSGTRRELQRAMAMTKKQFEDIADSAVEWGKIKRIRQIDAGRNEPSEFYHLPEVEPQVSKCLRSV